MHDFFLIITGILLASITYDSYALKSFSKSYDLPHGTVDNRQVSPEYDCALRAFTVEMAAYIAPSSFKANWTALSHSAFQMDQCNSTLDTTLQPKNTTKPFKTAGEIKQRTCDQTVYVHDSKGNDFFDGTFEKPKKTIQAAVLHTRILRSIHGNDKTLCITIRGGIYYLGTNATTTSSAIGAIALTSNDSNLVIENYQDERVILSGGTLLKLQWSVHTKTVAGGTIIKAQIPSSVNLDKFNELYIDGKRAIIAKYPNGDPSTHGLYTNDTGFSFDAESWIPAAFNQSVELQVDQPIRNGTAFPNFQLALGGHLSVFNPSRSFWSDYVVPRGFNVTNGALPRMGNWSKPSTGFIYTFHGNFWGSWVFEIASTDNTNNTIMFGRGGFQEARGRSKGGPFYVANIFEELDSPNEWFLDKDTRTLYFMPNETIPQVFVASQIPCLISLSGSSKDDAIENVLIKGLILTETSTTYMRDYMVPSGGDWSVHRGGTIYLTNTRSITITQNLFTQLGSNGVVLIDYNDGTSITLNEFVWLVDSAIILVGTTNGIDGFSVVSQPANTLIQSNLIHETGIYIKQSSPVFIAVSRSVSVIGNLMFNMPRAAINLNDGFYGNHTLSWNVIFNTVRETKDHGPINTWDRQPYLTDAMQPGLPSLWQHVSYIHHNLLFINYGSVWPIDHDDGSCFYEDSYNFLVYGGKKTYLGHSKTDHHEIYVYVDLDPNVSGGEGCLGGDYTPKDGYRSSNEVWVNNTCTLYQSFIPYKIQNCDTTALFVPYLASNKIYIPAGGQAIIRCKVNGTIVPMSFEQWQSYGLDMGTTVQTTPDVQTIIEWGREMLQHAM